MTDNTNHRTVRTVAEMEGLDWEVPGADFTLPALPANASKEEVLAHEERAERAVTGSLAAFERHNGVSLEGEAVKQFRTVAEVIYAV